jgi:type I restriction enzyme S subunit
MAEDIGSYPFFCSSPVVKKINHWLHDGNTILMGTGGVATVHYGQNRFAYSTDTWAFTVADSATNISFLFRQFEHKLKQIEYFGFEGSGLKHLQKRIYQKVGVINSPFKMSKMKIVKILDTIDTAIQQTQAIINKLKQLKQGLLHDLLTRGVDANGELRPCYEDAPHVYKESPLGWIPKEWEVKKLDSISSTVTSGSRDWARFYADTGALFIRIGNLTREHINFRYDSVIYVNPPANGDGQRTKLEAGDILISITADLGIIGVMSDRMGEAYINQHISLVRPVHKDVNSRFIGHYLCTSQAQNYISKLNDGGAKSGLNLPTIRSLEVSLPLSRVEQDCIATQLDNIDNQIQTSKQELEKLKSTKLGVMDDLLTGRIRVTSLLQTEASSV